MKILFLEIDNEREWAVASIGPAFIAAYVRAHGHQAELLRIPLEMSAAEASAAIRARVPGIVGLSLTSRQWIRARDLVAAIHRDLDVPVFTGGLQPTFAPEVVLAQPGFDYLCLGEGEVATLEVLEALERRGRVAPGEIRNVWVRGGPRPELRPPFERLDDLPFLARDLLDEPRGVFHLTTQRGCPFPCTYCAAGNFVELYAGVGDYGRRRSHASVLAEIAELEAPGPVAYLLFLDDTFTLDRPWVEEFCRRYRERFPYPFWIQARVETMDPQLLASLAAAGCTHVSYGIESGSYRVRREIMRRPVTDERIRRVVGWTRDAGIEVTANYIVGLPGETRKDLEMTLAMADGLEVLDFCCMVFYPYPGTRLYQVCREQGYLPEDFDDLPAQHHRSVLELPDLTPGDVAEYYQRMAELREQRHLERHPWDRNARAEVTEALRASAASM